jgi:predicted kinase
VAPPDPGGLLLRVSGLPGAGKTTLLTAAAAAAGFTVISRDLIRAALFPGPARHTPEQTRRAFELMLAAAEAPLRRGGRVALDGCCFAHRDQRDRARDLALATGATLVGVHLALRPADAVLRVEAAAAHPANDRNADLVARVAHDNAWPDPDDLVIDATLPPEEIWALVRRALPGDGRPGGSGSQTPQTRPPVRSSF